MWIEKLNKEELLELHKSVILEDTQSIDIAKIEEGISVTAYENWPYEDGTPAYIPTNYIYTDYDYIDYDTSDPYHVETVGKYRDFMLKKFGQEYLKSIVKEILGMEI